MIKTDASWLPKTMIATIIYTPLGQMIAASRNGEALSGLWFSNQKNIPPQAEKECNKANATTRIFQQTQQWIDAYFTGEGDLPTLLMDTTGTPFQEKVWNLLKNIPYGTTTTYLQLARAISPSMSAQAVGTAVGRNPIAIIVSCHRVVTTNGGIGGYAGGIERKMALLRIEGIKAF